MQFKGDKKCYAGYTPNVDVFKTKSQAERALADQKSFAITDDSLKMVMVDDNCASNDENEIALASSELSSSWLTEEDPVNREMMMKHSRREGFINAEKAELAEIYRQKSWKLVKRTPDMNVIGSMWVYKTKREPTSGAIIKERARFVAKGFGERFGIEFSRNLCFQCSCRYREAYACNSYILRFGYQPLRHSFIFPLW